MSDAQVSQVGQIPTADIAVPEHEREVRFYSDVLRTGESPLWREDLMNNLGTPVIGLGACTPEYAHLPLQWMPHIQVADVAASVAQALELGASELAHGKDDQGRSQWAVLQDPDGAAFGVIPVASPEVLAPAGSAPSSGAVARAGRISWFALAVPDARAAQEFYRRVIGWSVQDVEMEDAGGRYGDYRMACADGSPAAGICHARGVNLGLPAVWMMHLPVGDLAESLRRVEAGGGRVIKATEGDGGDCVGAVVQDPVGVCLALVPG